MSMLVNLTQALISENASIPQNQDEYRRRYDSIVARYEATKAKFNEIAEAIAAKEARKRQMMSFLKMLKAQEKPLAVFDNKLWGFMVDFITVSKDKDITVTLKDGTKIKV